LALFGAGIGDADVFGIAAIVDHAAN